LDDIAIVVISGRADQLDEELLRLGHRQPRAMESNFGCGL
jgi:hypothetical protein